MEHNATKPFGHVFNTYITKLGRDGKHSFWPGISSTRPL